MVKRCASLIPVADSIIDGQHDFNLLSSRTSPSSQDGEPNAEDAEPTAEELEAEEAAEAEQAAEAADEAAAPAEDDAGTAAMPDLEAGAGMQETVAALRKKIEVGSGTRNAHLFRSTL